MQAKVTKTERLLNLISYLLRSRLPVPFSEIAGKVVGYDDNARLDSIEKRFDRDKAELRNMGIPVEYEDTGIPETSGYWIPRDRFFLGKIELDTADALILSWAGKRGGIAFSSPLMKDAFASALRKFSIDAPEVADAPVEPASMLQVSSGHAKVSESLQVITAAVCSNRTIRFDYKGRHDEDARRRKVDPYGLGIGRGEWYLVGRCHGRDAPRMFKLARIVSAVRLTGPSDAGPEFQIPDEFDISDHLPSEPWRIPEQEPITVTVSAPTELAEQWERQDDGLYRIKKSKGKRSFVELEVRSVEPFLDWVVRQGSEVGLEGPPEVRERLRERLDRMAAVYEGRDS